MRVLVHGLKETSATSKIEFDDLEYWHEMRIGAHRDSMGVGLRSSLERGEELEIEGVLNSARDVP